MKTMSKKLASIVLALCLCFSLVGTALAAGTQTYSSSTDTEFSITVTNAADGEEYNAYKIFDVTYDDSGNYSYTIDSGNAWYSTVAAASDVFTLTQQGSSTTYTVSVNDGVEDDAIIAVFTEAGVPEGATADATATASDGEAFLDVTISGAGYYYVTTSLGSLVMIDTTDPNPTIDEKNGQPTVSKYVHENTAEDDVYGPEDDAYNEDTVLFEIEIDSINGAVNLVLHDSMDDELKIPDASDFHMKGVTLYTSAEADGIALVEGTDYTVTVGECSGANCTLENCAFEIHFFRSFDDVDATGYIELTYELLLETEGDAYAEDYEEIDNYAQVTFGTNSYSAPAQAETYSFGFEVNKYTNTTNAAPVRIWRTQNWVTNVNVYTGSQGGVKSIYLEPGIYTFTVDGINNGNWYFDNFDEFALLEVTGTEPTANIQDGDGNYVPNDTNGGYTIVTDDDGNYVYDVLTQIDDLTWVVSVETEGTYVIAGYMYDPVYHGDVGGINWASWQYSTAYFYYDTSHVSNKVDSVHFNGDGTVAFSWEGTAYADVSTEEVTNAPLSGAVFEVSNTDGKTAYFKEEDVFDEDDMMFKHVYLFEGWLSEGEAVPEGYTTSVTSPGNGMMYIEGLDTGTYTLTEIKAPDGYNLLTGSITVTIEATYDEDTGALLTHTVSYTYGNDSDTGVVEVENNTGTELPSTGGIGTTIFYIIGGILVVGAVVVLVTRRRANREA